MTCAFYVFIAACQKGFSLQNVVNQSVPVIPAAPDTVDQPLIIGMYRNGVFAGMDVIGNVYGVVIIFEMKGGCRSLCDKTAVDVQFVIVIGSNTDRDVICVFQTETVPEQNMQIRLHFRFQFSGFQLTVPYFNRMNVRIFG